jgi:hypothetical protein
MKFEYTSIAKALVIPAVLVCATCSGDNREKLTETGLRPYTEAECRKDENSINFSRPAVNLQRLGCVNLESLEKLEGATPNIGAGFRF